MRPDPQGPREGTLADTSVARLAYLAAAARWTGRLDLELPRGAARVHFRRGAPEHVHHPALPLGPWLEAQGVLTTEARAQAEVAASRFGGSFTAACFGLGLLDQQAGFEALARHASEAWQDLLRADEGRYRRHDDVPLPPDGFAFGDDPLHHLLRAVRRLSAGDLRRRLGERRAQPAMKSNASEVAVERLGFGPHETRLYALFDGVHSVEALAADLPEDDATRLLALAWLLGECDFLSFGPPGVEDPEPPPDWDGELARLTALRDRFARADHFTVLGLKRQCSARAVRQAFTDAVRKWHPDRAAGAPEPVLTVLRDLFTRAHAAHEALADDGRRRDYLNDLAAREMARDRQAEAARSRADHLGPVRDLMDRGFWDEAAAKVDEVLSRNPGLAAAWAWRAYLKVRRASSPERVKKEALDLLNRALKLDATDGEVFLAASRIAHLFGDEVHATAYLKKARALGLDDGV